MTEVILFVDEMNEVKVRFSLLHLDPLSSRSALGSHRSVFAGDRVTYRQCKKDR